MCTFVLGLGLSILASAVHAYTVFLGLYFILEQALPVPLILYECKQILNIICFVLFIVFLMY